MNYKIKDVCEVTSSKRIFAKEYTKEGIPFFRSQEVIEASYGKKVIPNIYISETRYNQILETNLSVPKSGDILISAIGANRGRAWCVNLTPLYFKDGNVIWLKNFKSVCNSKFLTYLITMDSFFDMLQKSSELAAQGAITIDFFKSININLPSLERQQHIVNIIGSVDDLIEKYGLMEDKILSIGLRKINLLNSIRDNVSFSKYGTFDKGIEVGSSKYIEKPQNKDELIPYLRVGDLDSLKYCYIEKGQSLKVCKADETLIAFDGAPGRINVGLIGAYSSGIYKVISQNKGFVFFELLSDLNQFIIKDNSQGTTILHASKAIPFLKVCEITNNEINYFERIYQLLVDIKVRKIKCQDIKSILLNKYFTN